MALTDNLVSYWKLDESSGDAADSLGTHTLTNNNTTPFASAKINNGGNFTPASNHSFSKADHGDFTPSGNFSFSLWAKFDASGEAALLGKGNLNPGTTLEWGAYKNSSDRISFFMDTDGNWGPTGAVTGGTTLSVDGSTWYHIVGVYNGSTLKVYLNGSEDGSASYSSGTSNRTGPFMIGRIIDLATNMDGLIDEVGYWTRDLSSTEVTELYNGGSGLSYPFVSNRTVSVSDALTISESVTLSITSSVNVNDALTISESVSVTIVIPITIFDAVSISESVIVQNSQLGGVSVSDAVSITESVTSSNADLGGISVNDSITVSESVSMAHITLISISDSISIAEAVTMMNQLGNINVNDAITITESTTRMIPDIIVGVAFMRSDENNYPFGMDDVSII